MSVSRPINDAADEHPAPGTRAEAPFPTPRPDTRRPRVVGGNPWRQTPELGAARS
jgi:hypothetical protein